MPSYHFVSELFSPIHPKMFDAMLEANLDYAPSGDSKHYQKKAYQLFSQIFEAECNVFFVSTGTAANVLALTSMIQPHQGVICPIGSHLNTGECGALERFAGGKLLTVPTTDGKLQLSDITAFRSHIGRRHFVQPRVVSITQTTECGTVYTIDEIRAIVQLAHENNLLVHMDGARLANAAASLGCSLADISSHCSLDVLSFGGTKNGMMMGEAVVFFNKTVAQEFKYIQKQAMQHSSRSQFLAAQFLAYLSDDLWLKNAQHANKMAQILKRELLKIGNIELVQQVQTNALFVKISKEQRDALYRAYYFYTWQESESETECIVRLVTSYVTTEQDIATFVAYVKECASSVRMNHLPASV